MALKIFQVTVDRHMKLVSIGILSRILADESRIVIRDVVNVLSIQAVARKADDVRSPVPSSFTWAQFQAQLEFNTVPLARPFVFGWTQNNPSWL